MLFTCPVLADSVMSQDEIQSSLNSCEDFAHRGDFTQALSFCNRVIEAEPNLDFAYNVRGLVYKLKGDFDQAISDFKKAVQMNSMNAGAYIGLGDSYFEKNKLNEAIENFTLAIKIVNPEQSSLYAARGTAYSLNGDFDKAITDFNKAIETDPGFIGAYPGRAVSFFEKQDYEKAWNDIHKIQELGGPINPEFLIELKRASGREQENNRKKMSTAQQREKKSDFYSTNIYL